MGTKIDNIFIGAELRHINHLTCNSDVEHGASRRNHLIAVSEGSPDTQAESVCVYRIGIDSSGPSPTASECELLKSFNATHPITGLQTVELGDSHGALVVSNKSGQLLYAKYTINSTPNDMQWDLATGERAEPTLHKLHHAHSSQVSGFDVNPDTKQVVSVGRDGAIYVSGLGSHQKADEFRASQAVASYSAVKWASLKTFVTSGPTGGLQVWDLRQDGSSPIQMGLETYAVGKSTLQKAVGFGVDALDMHPSRPHLCATGGADTNVCFWDLRSMAAPSHESKLAQHGDVTQISFDTRDSRGDLPPTCLLSTTGGHLLQAAMKSDAGILRRTFSAEGQAAVDLKVVASIDHSLDCFSFQETSTQEIIGCAGSESLVYMHCHA